MHLRQVQQWGMSDIDEDVYDGQLQLGETAGDTKREDLVYYLAVQPRHP
jgi:hypothetical protein